MTVSELCSLLVTRRTQEIQAYTENADTIPEEVFAEALTPDWLADNINEVFSAVNTEENNRENSLIGNLEINAFLAAFQKAYENQSRSRLDRWAGILSQKNRLISEGGALALQLTKIGVAVDDEFITNTVFAGEGAV